MDKTLRDFLVIKGAGKALTNFQLEVFGMNRSQLTQGWYKRFKNTPVPNEEMWEALLNSITPNEVKKAPNKAGQKLYVIRNFWGDYKIGIAKDVSKRIKDLLVANSEPLTVVRVYNVFSARKVEKTLHERYKLLHKRGEWFSSDLDLSDVDNFATENLCGSVQFQETEDNKWICL